MKKRLILIAGCFLMIVGNANGALLTFDDLITGATSYSFDGDGDTVDDVIFSTTDPSGFNTSGPGIYMTYIEEPGLEGTSLLSPDLRVDFLVGAVDTLTFGFALDSYDENDTATFTVYDSSDAVIASSTVTGLYTTPDGTNPSNYPEGEISVSFAGVASYATFDFTSDVGRYIIDNFEGTFGTSEVTEVVVDIKPGSFPNSINPKSKGTIPVAILSTADFDAATVDASTVNFGPGAATMVHNNAHLEDADADGDIDMVLHFNTQETGIQAGDTEATLTGKTVDGQDIIGTDSVRIVPKGKK